MAAVQIRKRSAAAFIDGPPPTPCHLKRGRFTGSVAPATQLPLTFDPIDALRLVFPDADSRDLETFFAATGSDLHAAVQAYRAQQAEAALASRLARAAREEEGGGVDECAYVLVEQMAAATDLADGRNRASMVVGRFMDAVVERVKSEAAARIAEENAALMREQAAEVARLREENAAVREHAAAEAARIRDENAALREQAAAAGRDNAVLKRGVLAGQRRYEEMEHAAKKKVAELEMANYALAVRLRDAEVSRFQANFGPSVF